MRFFLELTLELTICSLLNIKSARWEYSAVERLGVYLSWTFSAFYLLFFIFVIWLLFCGSNDNVMTRLLKLKYFKRVGLLYKELRFHTDALYLTLFFMLERIIFGALAVHWEHTLGQMFVLYLMTIFFILYLFIVQPHAEPSSLKIEIFS